MISRIRRGAAVASDSLPSTHDVLEKSPSVHRMVAQPGRDRESLEALPQTRAPDRRMLRDGP